jgi:DNA helicase-2/ATP-dependent DNA helicase PcrA
MNYLETLNPAQKEAVLHQNGPLLIIAGAGTGKTRVITTRILHLINSGILPEKILAITFTNKAAQEMRERVQKLLSQSPVTSHESPFLGTFHSLGVKILRENYRELGISKYFSIFDRDDSISTIKRILKDLGIDPKQHAPAAFLNVISKNKGEVTTLAEFAKKSGLNYFEKLVIPVWQRYSEELAREKAFDFDDLLLSTLLFLKKHPNILSQYQNRWSHIHVDEYQDTNTVQYELTRLLAGAHKNICVVGDHDQCIYTWRSADMRNLSYFEQDFADVKVVTLEENYRSTQTILTAANRAISQNEIRKEKNLFTNANDGEPLEVYTAASETDEAQWVAARAQELIDAGTPANEIAILFRANFQSRALEEGFLNAHVPYQVLGVRFFERKEVKDILSYITASLNPDSMTAISRIINVPARGIGKTTLLKIVTGQEHSLPAKMKEKISKFHELLSRIADYAHTHKPSEVVKFVLKESGIEHELMHGTDDDHERLANIKELATLAVRYDSLSLDEGLHSFLENATLASDQDALRADEETVKLMTIHAAKGLEFEHVFITGLEEGLFPDERSILRETPEEREEERRLFYVALTRAKKQAHLTHTLIRTIFGTPTVNVPSQFLTEIDEELVHNVTPENEWIPKSSGGLLDIEF